MQSKYANVMHKTKNDIRKEVRLRKKELSPLVFSSESNSVCQQLNNVCKSFSSLTSQGQNIVAFWPMIDEVDIRPFLENLLKENTHNIFLPVITGDGTMEFRLFEGKEKMSQEPQFGIWEPTSRITLKPELQDNNDNLLIIVPGVAFTLNGDRLGRGRGFYDRILTSFPSAHTVGVCLSCQIYDEIPTDPHDQKMNMVITPIL